jgi:hypothetical protein
MKSLEIHTLAQLAKVETEQVRPAICVLKFGTVASSARTVVNTLSVPDSALFVVTQVDADSFPLDAAGNPIFGGRQKNPPYADLMKLLYSHGGKQKHSTSASLRGFMGDTFLLFDAGDTSFSAGLDLDSVKVGMPTLRVWLNIVLQGCLVPDSARESLSAYQLQTLGE